MASEAGQEIVAMADAAGHPITKIALVGEDAAASITFTAAMENFSATAGISVVDQQYWPVPLIDATPIITTLLADKPDVVVITGAAVPDFVLFMDTAIEYGLKVPIVCNGAWAGYRDTLTALSTSDLQGVMSIVGNWPRNGTEAVTAAFMKSTNQPWMTQEAIDDYGSVYLFAQALQAAGSANPTAVRNALANIKDTGNTVPAVCFPGGTISFGSTGQAPTVPVILQWQNGIPVAVAPADDAIAPIINIFNSTS
jgi:branched-chain amino acid transport system substrate-binding protein